MFRPLNRLSALVPGSPAPIRFGSFLLLLFVAVPAGVDGQAIHGGITGGLASTNLVSDHRWPWRPGYVLGLAARVTITNVLALQVEAQDVERGFGKRNKGTRLHQRYVEVPVLLVAALPSYWGNVSPEIMVGVAPARERSCEAWAVPGSIGFTPPSEAEPVSCSLYRNQVRDVGAVLGCGASFDVGPSLVTVSLRYYRGTKTVWVSDLIPDLYNHAVVLGVSGMLSLWSRDQ
jgi:hypothetical protein